MWGLPRRADRRNGFPLSATDGLLLSRSQLPLVSAYKNRRRAQTARRQLKKSVGREGIEPPQPKAADLQSAELTTLLNLPAVDALHPILPVRSPARTFSSRREGSAAASPQRRRPALLDRRAGQPSIRRRLRPRDGMRTSPRTPRRLRPTAGLEGRAERDGDGASPRTR